MSTPSATQRVVVCNEEGLHARPASLVAQLALTYTSKVEIINGSHRADAKSILHVLTLGAPQGTELVVEAEGEDAQQAVQAITKLIASGFVTEAPAPTELHKI